MLPYLDHTKLLEQWPVSFFQLYLESEWWSLVKPHFKINHYSYYFRLRYSILIAKINLNQSKKSREKRQLIYKVYDKVSTLILYIYYIINSYRYVYIVSCIVTEKPHQGSVNKVLYCIVYGDLLNIFLIVVPPS